MTTTSSLGGGNIHRIWRLLSRRRKNQLALLLVILVMSVLFEAATITMIFPLINSLAQPEQVPIILHQGLGYLGGKSLDQLRILVAVLFIILVLISTSVRLLYLWASMRLSFAIGADFTEVAFYKMLSLPYEQQTRLNSSNLLSGLMVKMQAIVFMGMAPMLAAFGAIILASAIIITLMLITPKVTLGLIVLLLALITVIVIAIRRPLRHTGEKVALLQPRFTEHLQIARGGIREIILDGTREFFAQELSRTQRELRFHQAKGAFLSSSPRFLMEAVFLLVILGLAMWTFRTTEDPVAAIPALSIVALGAMKILPAAQLFIINWATIRNGSASVRDALDLVELADGTPVLSEGESRALQFDREIRFRDVWFRYGADQPWVLNGIDLIIRKGEHIGIVGRTGSGKSTLIDLSMGLLRPTRGTIEVDGKPLQENTLYSWRRRVAHVPQSIYLTDASVAENIAFGMAKENIRRDRVVEAAQKASIGSFVNDGLDGFGTLVGEGGARISGGQRQRIGIARALYKSADLIVLDEATSALDGKTEARVMETITDLGPEKTVLMIAHRLTTLRNCDRIIELNEGKIVRELQPGDFSEIYGSQ